MGSPCGAWAALVIAVGAGAVGLISKSTPTVPPQTVPTTLRTTSSVKVEQPSHSPVTAQSRPMMALPSPQSMHSIEFEPPQTVPTTLHSTSSVIASYDVPELKYPLETVEHRGHQLLRTYKYLNMVPVTVKTQTTFDHHVKTQRSITMSLDVEQPRKLDKLLNNFEFTEFTEFTEITEFTETLLEYLVPFNESAREALYKSQHYSLACGPCASM